MRSGRSPRGGASASFADRFHALTHARRPGPTAWAPCAQNRTRPSVRAIAGWPTTQSRSRAGGQSGCTTSSPHRVARRVVRVPAGSEVQIAENQPSTVVSRCAVRLWGSSLDLLAHRSDSVVTGGRCHRAAGSAVAGSGVRAPCPMMGAVTDHAMGVTASRRDRRPTHSDRDRSPRPRRRLRPPQARGPAPDARPCIRRCAQFR